jgi:putative transposase
VTAADSSRPRSTPCSRTAACGSLRARRRRPGANAVCERLVGTLLRELFDHILILNETHVRAVLAEYASHCNRARPHQGIAQRVPDDDPDHPVAKAIDLEVAWILRKPVLAGIMSEYQAGA